MVKIEIILTEEKVKKLKTINANITSCELKVSFNKPTICERKACDLILTKANLKDKNGQNIFYNNSSLSDIDALLEYFNN